MPHISGVQATSFMRNPVTIQRLRTSARTGGTLLLAILLSTRGPLFAQPPKAAEPTIEQLLKELRSADANVRIQAIDALANRGPAAKPAVQDLAAQLQDKSPAVRAHAA